MSALTVQMEAYAFRQLLAHLQWRTDVQNIDLMNLSGFCRNCLAKWYHAGAKVYGLPLEYSEACEYVYGEPYANWKKRHQKPATEDQMAIFEASKAKHARTDPGELVRPTAELAALAGAEHPAGHSSVCGQNCDAPAPRAASGPSVGLVAARVAVLTASDRAAAGAYEDKSGPAVAEALQAFATSSGALAVTVVSKEVVSDDCEAIYQTLSRWSEARDCNLIVTTGGTGFGPRDVTPEASQRVIKRSAEGLARAMAWQTSLLEPHSILSRGVCGVTETGALLVNLPGNPAAVKQCLAVLLPVLPHALKMLGS